MKLAPTPLAFRGRIFFLIGLMLFGFVAVLSGYWRLQFFQQEKYAALGEQYRIKKRPIKASRGFVYDRHGRLVAQNRPTYNLVLRRDEMEESWFRLAPKLSAFTGIPAEVLEERYRQRSVLLSQPVLLEENISYPESLRIRRNLRRYPGLSIEITEKRFYTRANLFSHVLGYVGEVSRADLERNKALGPGQIIGKSGVELAYNEFLTGVDGLERVHIDNKGVYQHREVEMPPEPGENLYLTIDGDLQQLAAEELEGNGGSIVMMDVRTGELLVYLSSPNFDPNLFTSRFSRKEWLALTQSPDKPLFNRPVKGAYAPGSIFKLVTALAALRNNRITPETRFFCGGSFKLENHVSRCHNENGHGTLDLEGAIRYSCNVYFYNVATHMDIDELSETAEMMGFGSRTGLDLIGESSGLMPNRDWKRDRYGEPWYPGESLNVAIGQGAILATPLQLVTFVATLAREGRVPHPHFMKKVGKNEPYRSFRAQERTIDGLTPTLYGIIKQAMWAVVNDPNGTGKQAKVEGFDVCGKTGTAQLINFVTDEDHKNTDYLNAWFAGFAPRDEPEIAIIVLVEQAGAGGHRAAPIAKQLIKAYRAKRHEVDPS